MGDIDSTRLPFNLQSLASYGDEPLSSEDEAPHTKRRRVHGDVGLGGIHAGISPPALCNPSSYLDGIGTTQAPNPAYGMAGEAQYVGYELQHQRPGSMQIPPECRTDGLPPNDSRLWHTQPSTKPRKALYAIAATLSRPAGSPAVPASQLGSGDHLGEIGSPHSLVSNAGEAETHSMTGAFLVGNHQYMMFSPQPFVDWIVSSDDGSELGLYAAIFPNYTNSAEDISAQVDTFEGFSDEGSAKSTTKNTVEAAAGDQARLLRQRGACVRCRAQRTKCDLAPEAAGLPCSTCTSVKKDSRKIIHNLPCRRWKLTEISLNRPGFLGFTKRFTHRQMGDIDGVGPRVRVGISVDSGKPVLAVEVHRFVPIPGDVTSRRYISNGTYKYVHVPPYCLADIKQTAKDFCDHVEENALHGLRGAAEEAAKEGNLLLSRTFIGILEHISGLQTDGKEYTLLWSAIKLWFTIRCGVGSAWLCGNDLGMKAVNEVGYPVRDRKPSVPRMVVAQLDSIRHEHMYKPLSLTVFGQLEKHTRGGNPEMFFTVYAVVFLFLDLVGAICKDRLRWAKENAEVRPLETRYGPVDNNLTRFVEEVQHSGVMLLYHWYYYKRANLGETDWAKLENTPVGSLGVHHQNLLKWTADELRSRRNTIPVRPEDGCWEHPHFWLSQMYSPVVDAKGFEWYPPQTFSTKTPSVGKLSSPFD